MQCAGLQESSGKGREQHRGDQHSDQHTKVSLRMHLLVVPHDLQLQGPIQAVCIWSAAAVRLVMSAQQHYVLNRPVLDLMSCLLLTPDMLLFWYHFIRQGGLRDCHVQVLKAIAEAQIPMLGLQHNSDRNPCAAVHGRAREHLLMY
jgi:hypothetical protein